jgi:superfamily I DNA/RNA helicase
MLPHKNSEIEEERRIGFVGLSRAMRLLYLSYSHDYLEDTNRRSTFLDEGGGPQKLDNVLSYKSDHNLERI